MATLTKTMLEDLHKGMTALTLKAYPEGGVKFSEGVSFAGEDQIFTLKDSFSLTPSDPTTEEIKIDQNDEIIDSTVEAGEYTMSGQIPSVATAILDYFMNSVQTVDGIIGQDGKVTYEGKTYDNGNKEVIASVMIESASKKTAIVFARVKFVVSGVAIENASGLAYVPFTATILGNTADGEGSFAVLKAKVAQ